MSGAENYLRFALQDLLQAVQEDVEQQTDKLREASGFAKQVLAMAEKEQQQKPTC